MKEYKVVAANEYDEFEKSMVFNLERGWKPQGGISITHAYTGDKSFLIYAQAIVRDKPPESEK